MPDANTAAPDRAANSRSASRYLTPQDIAAEYAVSVTTVYDWIKTGQLPAFQIGTRWRVRPEDLAGMISPGPAAPSHLQTSEER